MFASEARLSDNVRTLRTDSTLKGNWHSEHLIKAGAAQIPVANPH